MGSGIHSSCTYDQKTGALFGDLCMLTQHVHQAIVSP